MYIHMSCVCTYTKVCVPHITCTSSLLLIRYTEVHMYVCMYVRRKAFENWEKALRILHKLRVLKPLRILHTYITHNLYIHNTHPQNPCVSVTRHPSPFSFLPSLLPRLPHNSNYYSYFIQRSNSIGPFRQSIPLGIHTTPNTSTTTVTATTVSIPTHH